MIFFVYVVTKSDKKNKNNQWKIWRKINRLIDLHYAVDDENKRNKEGPVHVKKKKKPAINMTENSEGLTITAMSTCIIP